MGKHKVGWAKINIDGSFLGNPGKAGAGDVICVIDGQWTAGFSHQLGTATSMFAEVWVWRERLQLAWDKGLTKMIIEVDSTETLKMIEAGVNSTTLSTF